MSDEQLQITDIRPGTGKAVVKGALITTQYTGTLEDGTVFDSSWVILFSLFSTDWCLID